uniref:Uncharacterized protein n=1 Tax=Magnetococcus massalia (strain MO-1) TaxID=451514 RepID=A0A1S7LQ66_MAGMO|nr:protein of unknown function [Candidatus Magnetococcus massalia]
MPSLAWNHLPATLHEISGLGSILHFLKVSIHILFYQRFAALK